MTEKQSIGTALAGWNEFEAEIKARENEIIKLLPPNVDPNRFMASFIAAVKKTPDLLMATRRSLFAALIQSAQDGLIPDGREGHIGCYNTKQSDGTYAQEAKWNPMIGGLRKRARELDDIIIDAQCVFMNDRFVWHQGDDAKIEHEPATLNQDRGELIGAYAIFRKGSDILHREVMPAVDIEKVRKQSKAPDSLMWKEFITEGYRKTVVRRGIKTVPVSAEFAAIIKRDDEAHFDFTGPEEDGAKPFIPPKGQQSGFERKAVEQKPEPQTIDQRQRRDEERMPVERSRSAPEPITASRESQRQQRGQQAEWFAEQASKLPEVKGVRELNLFSDEVEAQLFPDQVDQWHRLVDARQREIIDSLARKP